MEPGLTAGRAAGRVYRSVRAVATSNLNPFSNVTTAVPKRSWTVTWA